MRKLLTALILLPVLVVLIVVVFVFTIDPTSLAPHIQKQLASQGIDARFKGKIAWQFYPDFGLSVKNLELNSLNTQAKLPELARLGSVSFAVEFKPLLKRRIKIRGIHIESANINLVTDGSGRSNWQLGAKNTEAGNTDVNNPQPSEADRIPAQTDKAEQSNISELRVKSLTLKDINVFVENQMSNSRTKIENLNVVATNLNLAGEPFPLEVFFNAQIDDMAALQIQNNANLSFELESGAFAIKQLHTSLSGAQLDKISLDGQMSYRPEGDISKIDSKLSINQLNLDQIMAFTSSSETNQEKPDEEPSELPFQLLTKLQSNIELQIKQINGFELNAKDLQIQVESLSDKIDIKKIQAQLLEGSLLASGAIELNNSIAELNLAGRAENINLGTLLKQIADNENLAGATDTDFTVHSAGKTSSELADNLSATALTKAKNLILQPLNIEKQYCKLVAILDKQNAESAKQLLSNQDWQKFTTMEPLEIKIEYKKGILTLEKLQATVSSLLTTAKGAFNLDTGKFDFPVSLNLQSLDPEKLSCISISESWLERSLPLRCKGEISKIGADTCLPDTNLIKGIVKAEVKSQADRKLQAEKERAQARLQEEKKKARDKVKDKIDKKLKNLLDKL